MYTVGPDGNERVGISASIRRGLKLIGKLPLGELFFKSESAPRLGED